MTNIELDIEQDRQIDPDSLDVEWLEQANHFYKYSDALDEAVAIRNNLKTEVERKEKEIDMLKAKLELEIRSNPDAFDLEKVTDSSVKAAILSSDSYEKSLEELFELKSELNEAQNKVSALYTDVNTMQEKKEALKNLVVLLNQQYFCTPSIPRNLTQEFQRHRETKKTQSAAREKVKGRKRRK